SNGREIPCDKILISIGRKPNVSDIGLENLDIKFDKKGIKVDHALKTNIDNIYAIGDCIGGYMYAHVASYEGIVACNNIAGKKEAVDYSAVPYCIFTNPDIASSGMNENLAKSKGLDVSVSKFYFRALGKAHTLDKTDGFIKLVIDRKTGKILGVDIMGEAASELIAEATLAIKKGLTPEDLVRTIHAHPTMSEAILEVAHVAEGKPIHTL
ncbi:MAG: FAD-dependent oxidoreductase, partial [Candidatus Omnitrophica bacterium]|nr:FAD-dependent oxidoreductase [Candidatus Omnitrophota bacterium]